MHRMICAGMSALMLMGAAGVAAAQQQQGKSEQSQVRPGPSEKEQSQHPGMIDGQRGNTAGQTPEDGQAIGLAPSDPNSPDDARDMTRFKTTQTTPAKHSAENAAKDSHWWLDRGLALSDEQKRAIYQTLRSKDGKADSGTKIFAEPSAVVPPDARLHEIPSELGAEIPYIKKFKFVVEQNKVVLVDPVNQNVAAVIGE